MSRPTYQRWIITLVTVAGIMFGLIAVFAPLLALVAHAFEPIPRHQSTAAMGLFFFCGFVSFGFVSFGSLIAAGTLAFETWEIEDEATK